MGGGPALINKPVVIVCEIIDIHRIRWEDKKKVITLLEESKLLKIA